MKYLKIYDAYKKPQKGDPIVGDYVICDIDNIEGMLKNRIGRIKEDISSDLASFRTYKIYYSIGELITVWDSEIIQHSKNKKELEIWLMSNKYITYETYKKIRTK